MRLIFDLDNTLINRDAAFLECLMAMFHLLNVTIESEALIDILIQDDSGRTPRKQFCEYLMARFNVLPQNYTALWSYFISLPEYLSPDPLLIQMLMKLKQRHDLVLLSNGSSNMQRHKLKKSGLSSLFDEIIISEEVGINKPDQAIFRLAIKETAPHNCIMIGDDPIRDIQPAYAIGMKTIWISPKKSEAVVCDQWLTNILYMETWLNEI